MHTQIFESELNVLVLMGMRATVKKAKVRRIENLFEGIGDPQLTCHS